MTVLTISSAVSYGWVGNRASVFALERLGFETCRVDTVQFSNHPGYGSFAGAVAPPAQVAALLDGLDRAGVLAGCDAVLSGYLGEAASGAAALAAVRRIKAARPGALYLCDPVIGDDGKGVYVRPGIPELLAGEALALADVATPNRFELEILSGQPVDSLAAAVGAARALLARGPRLVVATGVAAGGEVLCVAVEPAAAWAVRTPLLPLPLPVNGGGDLLAGLLLGRLLEGRQAPEALSLAVSGLYAVLERTLAAGRRELALPMAQEALAAPPRLFAAVPVG
ncbi:MAG: pyridoxal kinase PdxY [Magnetospirillum sp.]|nr:pyridoxal kinase PdxY [Magnetospirillum sp.]